MNIDIQTEHVTMQPEWHRMIDTWVTRCRQNHPEVTGVDVNLRHGDRNHPGEEVDVVALASGRCLRAVKHAELMAEALHEALDSVECELLVHEAVARRG